MKVLEVDRQRERISLSIKALQPPRAEPPRGGGGRPGPRPAPAPPKGPTVDDLVAKFKRR